MRYVDLNLYLNSRPVHTAPPDDDVTAFAPAIIEWGSENGLTQPSPATLQISVRTPNDPAAWPTLGDHVALTGAAANRPTQRLNLFHGVVSDVKRYPETDRDYLRLYCDDWRAVANRRYIGAPPWPMQTIAQRITAIMALAPEIPWNKLTLNNTDNMGVTLFGALVAQRTVDNQHVGQLLEETLSGIDWIITSGPLGLDFAARPSAGAQALLVSPGNIPGVELVLDEGDDAPVSCNAEAVIDAPRTLALDSMMNHVALQYPTEPDDDANPNANWPDQTLAWEDRESITRHGEAAFTTRTDVLDPTPRIEALSRAMKPEPTWLLEQYEINPQSENWPVGNFSRVIAGENTRELASVVFPHSKDPTIYAGRITHGRLTLGATQLERLELDLEPWQIGSGIGLRFDQFRSHDPYTVYFNSPFLTTFDQTPGTFDYYHSALLPLPRFNEMGALTFDDLATANKVTWKGIKL